MELSNEGEIGIMYIRQDSRVEHQLSTNELQAGQFHSWCVHMEFPWTRKLRRDYLHLDHNLEETNNEN